MYRYLSVDVQLELYIVFDYISNLYYIFETLQTMLEMFEQKSQYEIETKPAIFKHLSISKFV